MTEKDINEVTRDIQKLMYSELSDEVCLCFDLILFAKHPDMPWYKKGLIPFMVLPVIRAESAMTYEASRPWLTIEVIATKRTSQVIVVGRGLRESSIRARRYEYALIQCSDWCRSSLKNELHGFYQYELRDEFHYFSCHMQRAAT